MHPYEHYSEPARRVIFFARYEASCLSSPTIETEHLLLGLIRETRSLFEQTLGVPRDTLQTIRERIEARAAAKGEAKSPISLDLPIGPNAQLALHRAAEEAAAMHDERVRPAHILLALLHDEESVQHILRDFGVVYDTARKHMAGELIEHQPPAARAASLAPVLLRLRKALDRASRQMALVDLKTANTPLHEGGWSPKQVLGHLIDSASNNHQRFVRALLEPELTWPSYDGDAWVNSQGYASAPWGALVQFWLDYNMHLIRVIGQIPEEKVGTMCNIGAEGRMTLGELIASYVDHLEHHLNQISG